MSKLQLELTKIYKRGGDIEAELNAIIAAAQEKRINIVEIIPGKYNEDLRRRILRFLLKPEVKNLYQRIEKNLKNTDRIYLHFRHKNPKAYH
ncbi:MAG: DNA mismatch repair protein MutS [Elusimicrobia bacterium]|nr:DNA mismatch repair protein MutS [Candidatus Liberimonas magnetica]